MSFCPNCGKELAEGETCGCTTAAATETTPVSASAPARSSKKLNKIIVLIALIVAAILVLAVALYVISANKYKKAVETPFKLITNHETNIDKLANSFLPKDFYKYYTKAVKILKKSDDFDDLDTAISDKLNNYYENKDFLFDEGWTVKFDITDKEKLEEDDLKKLETTYRSYYDQYFEGFIEKLKSYDKYDYEDQGKTLGLSATEYKDLTKVAINFMNEFKSAEIKAGYSLKGRIVFTNSAGEVQDKTNSMKINVINFNGSWVISPIDALSLKGYSLNGVINAVQNFLHSSYKLKDFPYYLSNYRY